MFRMKSNALLLTVITTVSALAIALLSLSYIAYYSAEKQQKRCTAHFSITQQEDADKFKAALDARHISHSDTTIEVIQTKANIKGILAGNMNGLMVDPSSMALSVISDINTPSYDMAPEQTLFTGTNDLLSKFMSFKDSGQIELTGQQVITPLTYLGSKKQSIVSWYFTNGGMPVAIVDDSVFQRLKQDLVPSLQKKSATYQGIDIVNEAELQTANQIFGDIGLDKDDRGDSRLDSTLNQKNRMGLTMFIVGFLGLTFLITSGCILYFKQMDESEDEKPTYTILRKLGYTQEDLLKGFAASSSLTSESLLS